MIHVDSIVSIANNQVAADVGGELVILNVDSGEYFGLDGVGARIWALIEEAPRRVEEIRDKLLLEYEDVEPERCTADLLALLQDMHAAALIAVDEPARA
jgi:hypothetical protein